MSHKKMRILEHIWLACILILAASAARADVQYPMLLDLSGSAQIGASDLLTLHRGTYALENRYLRTKWFDEYTPAGRAFGIGYRFGKTVLVDNVLDHLTILLQHEFFGHGARYREFGFTQSGYELSLLPPYGDGSGRAYSGWPPPNRFVTGDEEAVMTFGGSESNAVLSKSLQYKWLQRGTINYRESVLYLFASNDLVHYILRTRSTEEDAGSNDILNYIALVNRRENDPGGTLLTLDDLKRQAAIEAFRPFQYFSLYTYVVRYLWSGEEKWRFPMLDLWSLKYLPSMRLGLTPFGSEFYFENFMVGGEKVLNLYLRHDVQGFRTFWGFGLGAHNVSLARRLSLEGCIDVWHQPPSLLGGSTVSTGRAGLGGSGAATFFYDLAGRRSFPRVAAQIGYKTPGYLEGEMLRGGVTVRLGVSFLETGPQP